MSIQDLFRFTRWATALLCACGTVAVAEGQTGAAANSRVPAGQATSTATSTVASPPPDYVIGPGDVLNIIVWREQDLTVEATVRPDGRISLPLINDIEAAGRTPDRLRVLIAEAASKFVEAPTVTVVVKQINSRTVFITGQVGKPGSYPLLGPTTVLQLLAMAGGVLEYADSENIVVVRRESGHQVSHRLNYKELVRGKNLDQNIELKAGDTVVVP